MQLYLTIALIFALTLRAHELNLFEHHGRVAEVMKQVSSSESTDVKMAEVKRAGIDFLKACASCVESMGEQVQSKLPPDDARELADRLESLKKVRSLMIRLAGKNDVDTCRKLRREFEIARMVFIGSWRPYLEELHSAQTSLNEDARNEDLIFTLMYLCDIWPSLVNNNVSN